MNTRFATLVFAFLLMVVSAPGAEPAYPNQPKINHALKKLTEAHKILTDTGGKQTDAVASLQEAHESLEKSSNNKGSFRATATRLTGQAIKHLEKGDTGTAMSEIMEAIEATNKAGKAGAN
jgi:hypothetical protein